MKKYLEIILNNKTHNKVYLKQTKTKTVKLYICLLTNSLNEWKILT